MRLAVAAAAVSLGVIAPGDHATAAYVPDTLSLTLQYEMVCGQPGRGPLIVDLPSAFRVVARPRVEVRGAVRPASASAGTVTVLLAKPPYVTCMSITQGTLRIAIAGVRAPAGTYVVRARVNTHSFAASVRVR
jgi:hypothetical protein